ncbi:MAG: UDP-glucose/GDP-mannose dehydrogenase family protein [Phycisphaerales bacterium]|nr:UDP-glucose/GDP-mannose dehydrogenase family protein [Phycisphaerales bacterium]
MNITMVGTGYVGLVTGACFAEMGNTVTCLDIDAAKIATLLKGESPIYEPGLAEMIQHNARAHRLQFTVDKTKAYRDAQIIFICVGTPSDADGSADLRYVFDVADDIACELERLGPSAPTKTIVVKSTVPVGTSHRVRDRIASKTRTPFHIADNPEFLKEGEAIQDFMRPDRVVCGVDEPATGEIMRALYDPFVRQGNPIFILDVRSAEMVKYASNAMLACKISFVNELANLCELSGADIGSVREGMCADKRIGNQFLYPGLGYGGSCFPKDTQAVVSMGRALGLECKLNAAVHQVNQDQRQHFWKKIVGELGGDLRGKSLAFWGVAFKPKTDDIREAPSLSLMEYAVAAGATVRAYDPVALDHLALEMPQVERFGDMYAVLDGAEALIICTEWAEFRAPDHAELRRRLRRPMIFDGRNLYRTAQMLQAGFTYASIGRATVRPPAEPGYTKSA